MQTFFCGCCSKHFPTIHKHTHHKDPRALGGKDTPDNLIEICPSCHDTLHAIAYRMLSKKTTQAQIMDSLALIFIDNKKAQDVCLELATKVRNAQIHSQEKGLGPNHIINIGTSLRKFYKPLIMNRYKELNLSQESYIRMLILNDLAKRFNLSVSLTEENHLMGKIKKEKSNTSINREM
jgi:hypothetical protein